MTLYLVCLTLTSPTGSAPADAPRLLTFVLEAPADSDAVDNAAYERQLAEQADRLTRAAASRPATTADALNAAKFLLDRRIEPPLSRLLHGIADDADRRVMRDAVRTASDLLQAATPSASSPSTGGTTADEVSWLTAVGAALAALAETGDAATQATQPARHALLDACRALAPYLDDPRAETAGLARLLQGTCYRRAGRADRAVEVLAPEGRGAGMATYEVFSRMEHCRALADRGHYAAALALAVRLEARSPSNVPVMHRTAAAHSFRALRLGLLEDWTARLSTSSMQDERRVAAQVREDAAKLRQSFGGTPTIALFRLGRLLPEKN